MQLMQGISPQKVHEVYSRITGELGRVMVGQEAIIRLLLVSLFARGHCLLIGVPGLAKTLLVRSLAETLTLSFKRIQFTPDLMPSDIIGSELLQEHDRKLQFEYFAGPIFANLLLADEVNRTPPKTQSALLEAMQEHRVTVAGESRPLPDPFLVVATQNPIEQEGTYPLPEAQLDRFMFNVLVDYPSVEEERRIVGMTAKDEPVELTKVLTGKAITNLQKLVRSVPVSDYVTEFVV